MVGASTGKSSTASGARRRRMRPPVWTLSLGLGAATYWVTFDDGQGIAIPAAASVVAAIHGLVESRRGPG